MNFLEELVRLGLIKDSQPAEISRRATEKYEGNIDKALLDFGLTEQAVMEAKSRFFNIPIKQIQAKGIPFEIYSRRICKVLSLCSDWYF
jgi:hypothetical protein